MSWIKKFISSFVLISISIIFGFLFIEAAYRLVSDNTEKQKYFQRTMLLRQEKISSIKMIYLDIFQIRKLNLLLYIQILNKTKV